MHIVDDPVETIHVYMVLEEEKRPYTVLPLLAALLCLAMIAGITVYSGQHPVYKHQMLTVPAQLLPPQMFTATQPIIPTGVKTYPAATAQGTLTITNGSVIAQTLPVGLTFISNTGISVITDEAVFVPAGDANGYGWAQVRAHAVAVGANGNIPEVAIDQVEGTSLYIRNLSPFTGGQDSYSVKYATTQDKQTALLQVRGILFVQISAYGNRPHYPCKEVYLYEQAHVTINWHCQFVTYTVPSYMHVTAVRLSGKNLIVDVSFIARPERYWAK